MEMFSFLLGVYLGEELLGHTVTVCLTIWGTSRLFSNIAEPFAFPPAVNEASSFSTSLPILAVICLYSCHSGCKP